MYRQLFSLGLFLHVFVWAAPSIVKAQGGVVIEKKSAAPVPTQAGKKTQRPPAQPPVTTELSVLTDINAWLDIEGERSAIKKGEFTKVNIKKPGDYIVRILDYDYNPIWKKMMTFSSGKKEALDLNLQTVLDSNLVSLMNIGYPFSKPKTFHQALKNYILMGSSISVVDSFGMHPIHYAVMEDDIEFVRQLIQNGARIQDNGVSGLSLLHIASLCGSIDVAKFLIEIGANVNSRDNVGETPLFKAARRKNLEMAKLLLKKGADVNVLDYKGRTALHRSKSLEVSAYLVEMGSNISQVDDNGFTPLHFATRDVVGQLEIIQFLVEKGAKINAQTNNSLTALHMAALDNKVEIAKFLLSKGADKRIRDNNGKNAGEITIELGYIELANLLK